VVGLLNRQIAKVLTSSDGRDRMSRSGFEVVAGSAEQARQTSDAEQARWARVIEQARVEPN
jgi:tripartite-type tricarboxylate transporter receptor subunit TctC